MAKSIKLDNELLLDSTSIAHDRKTLKQQFENNIYQLNEANVVSTIESLNTMITPGVYNLTTGSTSIVGLPPSFSEAFTLIVSIDKAGNSACIRQELIREEKSFVRYTADSGTTWSDWAIMATYKVGDIVITSTNVGADTMAARFGGTWELIDKEFTPLVGNYTSYFTRNTTNISEVDYCAIMRAGHSIRVRLNLNNKVVLDDDNVELGTLNLSRIGITTFSYTQTIPATVNDAVFMRAQLNATSGLLTHLSLFGTSATVAAGSALVYEFKFVVSPNSMLDDHCNKFYWQRIS